MQAAEHAEAKEIHAKLAEEDAAREWQEAEDALNAAAAERREADLALKVPK